MSIENPPLSVSATDYHTAGEPFRIVSGGVGPILGETVLDKRRCVYDTHCEQSLTSAPA